MPLLASLLVTMFGGLAAFFCKFVTEKVAFGLATVAAFTALVTGLLVTMSALINSLLGGVPQDSAFLTGLWIANIPALSTSFSVVFAADSAIFLYRWSTNNLDHFNR